MRDLLAGLVPEGRPSRLLLAAMGVGVTVGLAVGILDFIVVELLFHPVQKLPIWLLASSPARGAPAS
ncbi:MAG: hypothetical protein AAFO29_26105, partial [Actinomycetota bacterium]